MRKYIFALGASLATLAAIFSILFAHKALAFNASNLMDDSIFNHSTSMSAVDIDNFINQFPSSCISSNSGFRTPDPQGWSSSQNKYLFGGNVTVGLAIYDTAQLYHVNPQVILATLQKEQSVVTGSAGCHYNAPDPSTATNSPCGSAKTPCTIACPYSGGCMNIAMSYGCPNYCAAADEGFSLQLTLGTWLLRFSQERAYGVLTGYVGYEQGDENFNYSGPMTAGWRQQKAGGSSHYYDGTYTTSDGVGVNIANGATASLYTYTPFTSGNSNFDSIFQSWFGSIYDIYSWSVSSQGTYTDSNHTTWADSSNLAPGQKIYAIITAKNTGDTTWSNTTNPVRLATTSPQDRNSSFCDISDSPTWVSCNRAATMDESSVAPGGTATFEFWYKAPGGGGTFNEHFSLVADGLTWLNDPGFYLHTVVQPIYTWSIVSQASFTDAAKTTWADSSSLTQGSKIYLVIKAQNTGNITWVNSGSNPTRLGTSNPQDRNSSFCDISDSPTWVSCNRAATMDESSVAPGGTATFEFWYEANQTGTFREYFKPVVEGVTWMNDTGLNYYTIVHFDTSGASTLGANQALNAGQFITSADGRYKLIMQSDGNLVLYSVNRALWSSRTAGSPVNRVIMQSDGNLVLYDAQNKAYWSSGTASKGTSSLIMQSDGNLVIYDNASHPTWASHTNGQL